MTAGQLPATSAPKTSGDIKRGFVYKRVPHATLKSIANNEEIDAIHARWQEKIEPVLTGLASELAAADARKVTGSTDSARARWAWSFVRRGPRGSRRLAKRRAAELDRATGPAPPDWPPMRARTPALHW